MIKQLFRTNFESNVLPFLVFLALNALSIFLLATHHDPSRPASTDMYMFLVFWLLVFCLVAGSFSLLRYNKEKHGRLYAQLPVTSLHVRLAYWCHAAVYMSISSLVVASVLVYFSVPAANILLFTLLYFFHAGILTALISIITSNKLRLVPDEIRKRTVPYFLLATAITGLFLLVLGLLFEGYAHVYGGRVQSWSLFTAVMALLCASLVALDIRLFSRKDSYLG